MIHSQHTCATVLAVFRTHWLPEVTVLACLVVSHDRVEHTRVRGRGNTLHGDVLDGDGVVVRDGTHEKNRPHENG